MRIAKTITVLFILLVIPVSLFAQSKEDLKKAVSYYNKGNYSEAIKLFDPYLEKKSDQKVYYLKGYALYKMSKFNESRDSFKEAYALGPIPLIAQDKDDFIKGKDALMKNEDNLIKSEDGLIKNKDDLIKAISYFNKGNYSEAVRLFDPYLEKEPDPKVYFLKGYALYKMSNFNESLDSFKEAYAINPGVKVSKATDILLPPDKSNESSIHD
ncbi:MAG TPA: tetratricopeptide repeat protein [Nitrospinota bacterium]|jgi:tetratricopeptide (TPR) repeat protein|nr:tetratricopeptide repeat protein [Nitrospinota bacterium]|tara:strand:- start:381 stop:1016 length:636 start_codon:yes stop_codon:yes gene_type:complete